MLTSGLTNTPLTKSLLVYTITSSIALSLFDIKHLASIHVSPHFWPYAQFWRGLIWQVAGFSNSTEALFAAMLVYHLRVVERAWGKRKMATFLLTTLPYATILPPLLLSLYYATIPHTFRYRIGTTSASASSSSSSSTSTATAENTNAPKPEPSSLTLLLSDKSTTYLVAAQLALSQFPAMLLPSAVGWTIGVAWRAELLPGLSPSSTGFRVPAWLVGERERRGAANGGSSAERERYEDLRRRLEGEVAASTGVDGGQRRSGTGEESSGLMERLRGAF
ncbi:uncharacterized protein N7443_004760 [Penicillium atrosanguineum]|uniref:uncharacterized protein n=1 Tax=Penicillium atrosanguineum TaxID=1132637 RepID=UPI00238C0301|nr:uncharacterized protein N7443_004760 [Penicillium atrosanguineum]KAJ5305100.1 hypothetical protein N7443_004760 [Penicillium atrosanguineum]